MANFGMKKKIVNRIFGKGFLYSYIRDSCNSVGKKNQFKLLNEERKSKWFEKSEDQTVDGRHCKFFLPE